MDGGLGKQVGYWISCYPRCLFLSFSFSYLIFLPSCQDEGGEVYDIHQQMTPLESRLESLQAAEEVGTVCRSPSNYFLFGSAKRLFE